MLRKYYWFKVNSKGNDVCDGVVSVWLWQNQADAHRKAISSVISVFNGSFSFSEFKRVY